MSAVDACPVDDDERMALLSTPIVPGDVVCECGHTIWDGEAIRSRCVKPAEGVALCRCKRWVAVPIGLSC